MSAQSEVRRRPNVAKAGQDTAALVSQPEKNYKDADYNREMLLAKAYYSTSSIAGVFLFPYQNLYLVDLGATAVQIGLLCTIRPWLGCLSTLLGPLIADALNCHKALLVVCFGVSTFLRSSMWISGELPMVVTLLILAEVFAAPVGPFIDSHVQHRCKKESDYGRQRLWASLGWGLAAPIAGAMVQSFGLGAGFLFYTGLSIPALICATLLEGAQPSKATTKQDQHVQQQQQVEKEGSQEDWVVISPAPSDPEPKASIWEGLKNVGGTLAIWQLLLQCLASGIGGGMIGTYLFIFARDQGAVPTLMGLLLMANCAAEVPMFYWQEQVMKWMSPSAMLNVSLGALVLRLLLYAVVGQASHPWFIVPVELLQGMTMALAWSGACVMSKRLAPKGLEATVQGVVTATFGGLGGGFGGLLGGVLRERQLGWSTTWMMGSGVVTVLWMLSIALPLVARTMQPITSSKKKDAA